MSRLQRRCLLWSALGHAGLLATALLGSAFFAPSRPPEFLEPVTVLEFIPDELVDANLAHPGGPAPEPTPVAAAEPTPPAPRPKPAKSSSPPPEPTAQPTVQPEPQRPRWRPSKQIKVDLSRRTRRSSPSTPAPSQRTSRELARAFEESMHRLGQTFRRDLSFSVPGAGGASYASYAAYVKSVYDRAWREPPATDVRAGATVKARIVIARDGTVVSAEIIQPSGDPALDRSVREALNRVHNIGRPFPAAARDDRRTFILNFNLEARDTTG